MLPALGLHTVQQAQGRTPMGSVLAPSVAVLAYGPKARYRREELSRLACLSHSRLWRARIHPFWLALHFSHVLLASPEPPAQRLAWSTVD